jgi:hypothetical protein
VATSKATFAISSLLETLVDLAERRSWFLFEAIRSEGP